MKSKHTLMLAVFLALSMIYVASPLYAETHTADQESIEMHLGSLGDVRVKHIINDSEETQHLRLIGDVASNITVVDTKGNSVEFTISDSSTYILAPSEENIIVGYDLPDMLVQRDMVWSMDINYAQSISVLLPDEADMVFVNSTPIYLGERNGIKCHGCYMLLEYIIDEPRNLENIQWQEDKFLVEIRTLSAIDGFVFDQPTKSISFDIKDGQKFVTAIIPTELLGSPYSVFFNNEKMYFHEYINNGTHVWLNAKPDSGGRMEIIGTTVIPEFSLMIPLIAGFVIIIMISRFKIPTLR